MLNETDINGLERFLSRQLSDDTPPAFSEGDLLGEWRVTGFLGRGGTSEVYRVSKEDEYAAAKVLIKLDESSRRRFAEEMRFLSENALPQFPRFVSSGETGGCPYIITEVLDPIDMPSEEKGIASYLLAVCETVAALHRSGFVHRDLKPKNIMRRKNGEVVLIDFGLAKDTAQAALPRSDLSIVDGRPVGVGTPDYAAPEQWLGGEASPAADIHALGRIANAAFDGSPPRNWNAIIRRATSSIPEQRYRTVEEFAAAIRARHRLRHWMMWGMAMAAVLGVLSVVFQWQLSPAARERRAWRMLCDGVVVTNLVQKELVKVVFLEQNGMKIPAERYYRMETNRVSAVQINLHGATNVFSHPIDLVGGCEYWVMGPGVLDGTFRADGTNVMMRLKKCIVRNHSAAPMGKTGILYDLQDNAGLELPDLDEPDDHGRHFVERSGSPTSLTFKKVDWEPVSSRPWISE